MGMATIAGPLTDLLQKNAFTWTDLATSAFLILKSSLTSAPILHLPDFSKPFIIETNASGQGIGAALLQDNHLICYYSNLPLECNMLRFMFENCLLLLKQ